MFTLNCKGRLLVAEKPLVMGIINATPDSFYEGSRFIREDLALREAEKMIREGADLLDLGGQSSRPGAEQIGIDEEIGRVVPLVISIAQHFPEAIISIDTFHAAVAREAVAAGASMINDISAGQLDRDMLSAVAALKVPYIAMHMRGDPASMQQLANYDDLVNEVLDFFIAIKAACLKAGISDLIIDPGFGFAKTIRHNFMLLKQLSVLRILDCPIMVGLSRKSTIYKTLQITPEEALNGTTVLNVVALMKGAQLVRVHDVKEAREAVDLLHAMDGA